MSTNGRHAIDDDKDKCRARGEDCGVRGYLADMQHASLVCEASVCRLELDEALAHALKP